MLADAGVVHAGVARDAAGVEALMLALAGGLDAVAHGGGGLGGLVVAELVERESGSLDVDVYAVEERAAYAGAVFLNEGRSAAAFAALVPQVAAGARPRCLSVINS